MVERTLHGIRAEIESLAADDGAYCLVCARTGERPHPVAGERFDDRATAARAAVLAERYRAELRRYDPRAARHDLVACEAPAPLREPFDDGARDGDGADGDGSAVAPAGDASRAPGPGRPSAGIGGRHRGADAPDRSARIEFCHRVIQAVFETLRSAGRDAVERAVMDAYLDAAGGVSDPDELCLALLDRTAAELGERLGAAEQARILSAAGTRLSVPPLPGDGDDADALAAVFDRLVAVGLLADYAVSPWTAEGRTGTRSRTVRVTGYALPSSGASVATLPITVSYLRHRPNASLTVTPATRVDDGSWRITIAARSARSARRGDDPAGLTRVPLTGEPRP